MEINENRLFQHFQEERRLLLFVNPLCPCVSILMAILNVVSSNFLNPEIQDASKRKRKNFRLETCSYQNFLFLQRLVLCNFDDDFDEIFGGNFQIMAKSGWKRSHVSWILISKFYGENVGVITLTWTWFLESDTHSWEGFHVIGFFQNQLSIPLSIDLRGLINPPRSFFSLFSLSLSLSVSFSIIFHAYLIELQVFYQRMIGYASYGEMSLFFLPDRLFNGSSDVAYGPITLLYWIWNIHWHSIPWLPLSGAAGLNLGANLLGYYGLNWTYEIFLSLGILLAIPVSAG